MFLNAVDKASGYQLVAPVDNKRPDIIVHAFMQLWVAPRRALRTTSSRTTAASSTPSSPRR